MAMHLKYAAAFIPINFFLLLLIAAMYCNAQNVQIIYYNSTYTNSMVHQQNNFGDSNGNAGGMNVNSGQGSSQNLNNPSEENSRQGERKQTAFSPYFGVEFVPYVRSASFPVGEYTTQDLRNMLNVILTKSHSVLTLEMGFPDQDYSGGPWDVTAPSQIATVAAQLNSDRGRKVITVSQGAGVLNKEGSQPDIEAAFYSAQHANSIFRKTVWGITLIPNYYDSTTEGNVQISKSGSGILRQLELLIIRAHEMNLKLGVLVDQCEDILGGAQKKLLTEMAKMSDHIICSIYPKQPVSDPQDYFNVIVNLYETIKVAFYRQAPSLEVILQTGWATRGQSRNNPEYMNSPEKSKRFWDLMQKWAEDKMVRVFMHEAFDVPKRSGNSSWGYWKWKQDTGEIYVEKFSGNVVPV